MRFGAGFVAAGLIAATMSLAAPPGPAAGTPAIARAVTAPVPDVQAFGDAGFYGSTSSVTFNQPIAGIAGTSTSRGYWEAAIDGAVFSFGDAHFYGSLGGSHLNQPIVGIAPTRTGRGYWLVASDGGIFTFGDAHFYGSLGGTHLNQPIVGIAPTRTGRGYWLVARDGGIFTFGDAHFYGSLGGTHLNQPIVGIAPTRTGTGYWLVASDGGVFALGHAYFWGAMSGTTGSIVGIAASPAGYGYWLAGSDGALYPFGWVRTLGGAATAAVAKPIVGIAPTRTGRGYWLVGRGTPGSLPGEVNVIDAGHSGGSGEIQLNWDAVPGATGYRIVRATTALGPFSFAADVNVVTGATSLAAPVNITTGTSTVVARITNIYSDHRGFYPPGSATSGDGLPSMHFHYVEEAFPRHYFRVTAYNANGQGPASIVVCGTPITEPDC